MALPAVTAQGTETLADVNAHRLNVLVYHPTPDSQGDTWGVAWGTGAQEGRDYMAAHYGASLFPTTVVDGVIFSEGATSFLPTYNAYEAFVRDRFDEDTPLTLRVTGALAGPMALVDVNVTARAAVESTDLRLRIALFEDDVGFDGGNGVGNHRFVVRDILNETPVAWHVPSGTFEHTAGVPVNESWSLARVGFVVWITNADASSRTFEQDEVVQSATYQFSQVGPTVQTTRGVLLETYSATWCPTCVYGDAAVDELANQYGVASTRLLDRAYEYWRPFDAAALVAAGVAGTAAFAVLWHVGRRTP